MYDGAELINTKHIKRQFMILGDKNGDKPSRMHN